MGKFAHLYGKIDEATLSEALRKKGSYEQGDRKATVHHDAEWEEYRVKHHVNGVHQVDADYHTDDKDDAHSHAKSYVSRVVESSATNSLLEAKVKAYNERAEEYTGHRSDHTGIVYHLSSAHEEKLKGMKHKDSGVIEAVHHDGSNLHVRKYEATKVHDSIHLHDRDGNHLDSFKFRG